MKLVFWALLTLAAVAVAGEETEKAPFVWLQHYGSSEHDNWRERKDGITWPKVLWRVPEARGEPTLEGKLLYAGGRELLAIDRSSGRVEGRVAAGEGRMFAQAPAIAGKLVIARRTDGLVRAYSRDLAKVVWDLRDGNPEFDTRRTGSVRAGLYVYAARHRVRALDVRTGDVMWSYEQPAGERIRMVPAVDAQRVYAGTTGGRFVALDLKTGQAMWEHAQDGAYGSSNPVVVENMVLVGDRGVRNGRPGQLRAFQAKSGRVLWNFDFGATGLSTPGHAPGYALLGFGRTAAKLELKRQGIEEVRTGVNAFGSPTLVGETFYFGNLDGHLYAYGRNLDLQWRFHVPGTMEPPPGLNHAKPLLHQVYDFVHTGTQIYVATSNGLYCLVQDPEKRGKLPNGAVIE